MQGGCNRPNTIVSCGFPNGLVARSQQKHGITTHGPLRRDLLEAALLLVENPRIFDIKTGIPISALQRIPHVGESRMEYHCGLAGWLQYPARLAERPGKQLLVFVDSFVLIGTDNFGGAGRLAQTIRNNAGTADTVTFDDAGSATTDSGPSITAGASVVLSEITSTASTEVFVNGSGNGSTALSGTRASMNVKLAIGAFNGTAQFFDGRYYGSIHYKGVVGGSDPANAVSWLQAKM